MRKLFTIARRTEMRAKEVYRFTRPDGGVTVSPKKPSCDFEVVTRLCADAGFELFDGNRRFCCIDTDEPEKYREVAEI